MLVELLVENYAVVERLRVRFHPGLNLLTGETGSGKSIVVDALSLLFGERASSDLVRSGAKRARISGIFSVAGQKDLAALLEESGIDLEDGELLLEREILASGKSRAFAGSRPATAGLLRELAPHLGDIHGQHDQQRLCDPETQLDMLDSFAATDDLKGGVAELYRRWQSVGLALTELERSEQQRLQMADLWRFQHKEIEEAAPEPGEDEALEQERRVLKNVARLEENTSAAYDALYDSASAAVAQIRQAWRHLDEAAEVDGSLAPIRDSLKPAEIAVEEAAHDVRHYLGRLEADPARLEFIETRLATLDSLKRKYGGTIEEILKHLDGVRANLEAMESADEQRQRLEEERAKLAGEYEAAAKGLSEARRKAGRQLEKKIESELRSLAMAKTVFRIDVTRTPWSAGGFDGVQFLVSPNPGEEPRPIDKVASGGELSRIALALKTCTADPDRVSRTDMTVRTLVFDEVDAGVGGSAAEKVGRRLKQLAATNQVLCVTHLPQIAGFADHHYFVSKSEANGRTLATVDELTPETRIQEIGRMLSGERLTKEALKHAEQLIRMAAS